MKEQNNCLFPTSLKESEISFWIDSSGGPEHLCNNSFYGSDPKYYIYGSLNEINLVDCESGAITFDTVNCFDFLEEKLREEKENKNGIFVGYFSYDLSDFFFAYFDNCKTIKDEIQERCPVGASVQGIDLKLLSNMTDIEYLENVLKIKEEIKNGNVYQVNLTRKYMVELGELDELDLYLRLRQESPNPYGCYFKTPFLSILSSSPEEFIHVSECWSNEVTTNRTIRTRPIKGTLPEDEKNIDPKNQAENIMIVDLERNDLGRICEYGSVKVKNLLELEKYKNLNHVVSTLEGKLKDNVNLKQIFEAMFPSGSITGAPKIAAMKIINEIEPSKRGAYTGSFGYIKTTGEINFNILIRTIFVENRNGEEKICPTVPSPHRPIVSFNVGGGIVADSSPEVELEEIRLKAKGIMKALGIESC